MSPINELLTKTGPIRAGLDYQDSYALSRLVEWLEHPDRYAWMQMESTEAGFLDDLVIASGDGRFSIIQIKYSVHPDAPAIDWSWKTLLSKRKKTKKTLLQKWSKSWFDFKPAGDAAKKVTGFLVTNQAANPGFLEYLKPDSDQNGLRVNERKLGKIAPGIYDAALKNVGSPKEMRSFFHNFYFLFDQPDLDILKESARARLLRLGGDDVGFRKLQEAVRLWAQKRDLPRTGGTIFLEDVRSAAGWYHPKSLLQSFPVPSDFVLFNASAHAELVRDLSSPAGGIKVVAGTPGTGKSTYLSYLYTQLDKNGVPCLRHHYFLSLDSIAVEPYRRLTPDAARESLIHDLMDRFPDALGMNANRNPHPSELSRYVKAAADYFYRNGTTLVIVVDGLDHVLREREAIELNDFLADLLPISNGLWLVLGTRPLSEGLLPSEVYERAPVERWIRLTGWDQRGSRRFLWHHRKELNIADTADHFNRMATAFHEKSKGHPLYSRKLLEEIRKFATVDFVSEWQIASLPQFPGDIESVYENLWRGVSFEAQQVAVLLAVARMPLKQSHLVECLGGDAASSLVVQRGIMDLRPFVEEHRSGLALFHSSFKEFVTKSEGFDTNRIVVLNRLKEWLTEKAPEEIKWSHLHRIEYLLGDPAPLLNSVGREWIIRAICDARPPEQVVEQVSLATDAAMQIDNYPLGHKIGVQGRYLKAALDLDEWDGIWFHAWLNRTDHKLFQLSQSDIESFSNETIVRLAVLASSSGEQSVVSDCLTILYERMSEYSPARQEFSLDSWGKHALAFCTVAALKRVPTGRMVDWLKYARRHGRSKECVEAYASALVRSRQFTKLRELLNSRIPRVEKSIAVEAASKACITHGRNEFLSDLAGMRGNKFGRWSLLYRAVGHVEGSRLGRVLPNKRNIVDPNREHLDQEEEAQLKTIFVSCYLGALLLAIDGKETEIFTWMDSLDTWVWASSAARLLARIGQTQGQAIRNGDTAEFQHILAALTGFQAPTFPERRDIYFGGWKILRATLASLLELTNHLQRWRHQKSCMSIEELHAFRDSAFYGREMILELLASSDFPFVNGEVAEQYLVEEKTFQSTNITYFTERAKTYLFCAELSAQYGFRATDSEFLKLAAENILGYGFHKDLYLSEILDAIEACHAAGSNSALAWLKQLAPLTQSITEYTDGDETRYTPIDLAKTLEKISPDLLRRYYVELVRNEDLFLAEDIFPTLIESLDLSEPVSRSVATTIVDNDSFEALKKAVQLGESGAQTLVEELKRHFNSDEPEFGLSSEDRRSHDSAPEPPSQDSDEILKVPPSQIRSHLLKETDRRKRVDALGRWLKSWLAVPYRSKQIYDLALEWISLVGFWHVEKEIYDLLVPYALEFDDPPRAFDFFCRAYERSYGWIWYMRDMKEIEVRWKRLQTEFPGQWRAFIKRTCFLERFGAPQEFMSFLPLPRGVQFLVEMGATTEAEELTAAAVETALTLMADLNLPPVRWLDHSEPSDAFDVLLARLQWPSAVVRERTASAISKLMLDPLTADHSIHRLLGWLGQLELESLTVVGLLPIAKAARASQRGFRLDLVALRTKLRRPSVVSDTLLSEIEYAMRVRE